MISTVNLSRFISSLNQLFRTSGSLGPVTPVVQVPGFGVDLSVAGDYAYDTQTGVETGGIKVEAHVLDTGLYRAKYVASGVTANTGGGVEYRFTAAGNNVASVHMPKLDDMTFFESLTIDLFLTTGDTLTVTQAGSTRADDICNQSVFLSRIVAG